MIGETLNFSSFIFAFLILNTDFEVEALVGRIERIRHSPLNINISESVDDMMACIRRLQSQRKDEINGSSARHKKISGVCSPDGRGYTISSCVFFKPKNCTLKTETEFNSTLQYSCSLYYRHDLWSISDNVDAFSQNFDLVYFICIPLTSYITSSVFVVVIIIPLESL